MKHKVEQGREHRRADGVSVLLLVVIPAVFFFGVLFSDQVLLTSSQTLISPWSQGESTEDLLGERSFRWDAMLNYYPRRYLAHEALTRGELPLWNPHSAGGMPLLADFQSAVYYPVNLVLNLWNPLRAMGWFVFIHVVLAGVFTYAFLRLRTRSPPSALFGAVAYMLSGFLVTRIGHPTMVAAAAWLPCLFLVVDRIIEDGGRRWFVALSAATAAAILSGFPQVTIHCLAAVVLYFLWRGIVGRVSRTKWIHTLLFAGCGVGLAGLQWIPTLEFAGQSGRMAESLGSSLWRTPPASFLKLLAPEILGNPVEGTNWIARFKGPEAHPNDIGLVAYVGVLALVFGLLALVRVRRSPEVRFFALLGILTVLASLFRPVFSFLYLFVPGAGAAQADRLAFLLSFCLACLASKGFGWMSEGEHEPGPRPWRPAFGVVMGLLALLGIAAVLGRKILMHLAESLTPNLSTGVWVRSFSPQIRAFLGEDLDGWYRYELQQLVVPGILLVAAMVLILLWRRGRPHRFLPWGAVAVLAIDLLLFARAYYTPQPMEGLLRETPGIQVMRCQETRPSRIVRAFSDQVLPANLNVIFGIDDAQGYNALMVDRYGQLFDLVERGTYAQRKKVDAPRREESFDSPILDLLNIEFAVAESTPEMLRALRSSPTFQGPKWEEVYAGDLLAYRNLDVLPRALWLPRAKLLPSCSDVAFDLTRAYFDPSQAVLLERDGSSVPWWATSGGGEGSAALKQQEPRHVAIETVADAPGWLRWAEAYYPGWRVTVDGAEVPSWRSDLALRAVPLRAGTHRVDLTMDPASTRVGAGLTVFSLVSLLLLSFGVGTKPSVRADDRPSS